MAGQLERRQTHQDLGRLRRQVREDRLGTQTGNQRRGLELGLAATRLSLGRQDAQNLGAVVGKVSQDAQG